MKVKEFISVLDATTKWIIINEYGCEVWRGQGPRFRSENNYFEILSVQWTKKGLKIFAKIC
jgi:hypothetical protein